MHSIPVRPFVSSNSAVAAEIERWLDRQGYQISYGPQSARAERGDLLLGTPANGEVSVPRAEAA